ncbi:MAG TPA: DUF72 domain-containing protein, partial [Stellaceae bacterium]|nr:DUF72 domain-containing protein [Stellaceae bacterium]
RSETDEPTGYAPEALDAWATRLLELAGARDGFVYFINGAKERAPAAAMALLERLGVAKPAPQPSTAKPAPRSPKPSRSSRKARGP